MHGCACLFLGLPTCFREWKERTAWDQAEQSSALKQLHKSGQMVTECCRSFATRNS